MKASVKKAWVARLRSGKYKQGQGALRQKDPVTGDLTHCCLGVLCDLYKDRNGGNWKKGLGYDTFLGEDSFLPKKVREWAGLLDLDPIVDIPGEGQVGLSDLNDGGVMPRNRQLGFKAIATIIERNL